MKTPCAVFSRTGRLVLGYVLLASVAGHLPLRAATEPAEPKTHTLFMGLDLSIEHLKAFHRVKDVSGSSFIITAGGSPVFLPVNKASHNLKVEHSLKITRFSAAIADLRKERTYTPRNDPRMQRQRAQLAVSTAVADDASLAMGKYINAQNNFGVVINPEAATGADITAANLAAAAKAAGDAAYKANQMSSTMGDSDMTSSSFYRNRIAEDLDKELFDAIEAEFTVSSDIPLNNPYVLLIARFREPKGPPSSARNWIYAESLNPITKDPQRVHVLHGGFPLGFILDDFQVHVYNRGDEVATNVSPKRVPLTREEAFEYVMIQHVAGHKGATLPAVPAMGQLPADMPARLSGGQFNRTYYVKVSKDGLAGEVFLDAECSQKTGDPYVESLVKNIRFKPALEKGKPVDAVAPLKLGDLTL